MGHHTDFDQRIALLHAKHADEGRGAYRARVRSDGTIFASPARGRGILGLRPMTWMWLLLAGFIGFKSVMLSSLGADGYAERLALLENGNDWEQAAAWALQMEPITAFVTYDLRPEASQLAARFMERLEGGDIGATAQAEPIEIAPPVVEVEKLQTN